MDAWLPDKPPCPADIQVRITLANPGASTSAAPENCHCKPITVCRHEGRLDLTMLAVPVGKDWQILLTGGEAHLGATALASPGIAARVLAKGGHREGIVVGEMSDRLANALGCTVCASAGIHYDTITATEIRTVISLVREMTEELLEKAKCLPCTTEAKKVEISS